VNRLRLSSSYIQ